MVIMNKAMFKMLGNLKEENHLKKSFLKKKMLTFYSKQEKIFLTVLKATNFQQNLKIHHIQCLEDQNLRHPN